MERRTRRPTVDLQESCSRVLAGELLKHRRNGVLFPESRVSVYCSKARRKLTHTGPAPWEGLGVRGSARGVVRARDDGGAVGMSSHVAWKSI
jgi:hypothetical protein